MSFLLCCSFLPSVLVLQLTDRHRPPRPLPQRRLEEHRRRVRVDVGQPESINGVDWSPLDLLGQSA